LEIEIGGIKEGLIEFKKFKDLKGK